jgi:hypothetical protein
MTQLADELAQWNRCYDQHAGGTGKLLRALIRRGLDPGAVRAAAMLAIALDERLYHPDDDLEAAV